MVKISDVLAGQDDWMMDSVSFISWTLQERGNLKKSKE